MNILFKDFTVLALDPDQPRVMKNASLTVEDSLITSVGSEIPRGFTAQRVILGRGKILMPGFVNSHTHMAMYPLRNYAEGLRLREWLRDYIFPAERRFTLQTVYISAMMGIAEAVAGGITSFSDMYFLTDSVARAAFDSGIKANICRTLTSDGDGFDRARDPGFAEASETYKNWNRRDFGRILVDFGIHAEYTSRPEVWKAVADLAWQNEGRIQLHLSETREEHEACKRRYGVTPARILYENGLFDRPASAAHCVRLEPDDRHILKRNRVAVVHCPQSNMKLASGFAPVADMVSEGMQVALGTDGVASGNSMDMFSEMKAASLLQKGLTGDPSALPPEKILEMAARTGARAQGRGGECGMLRPGLDADLVVIDTDRPHLLPRRNPAATVVYSARPSDVVLTMVRGQVLYENGIYPTIDIERYKSELETKVMPMFI